MDLQFNEALTSWATISESPISYMHKKWWSALEIEDLYELYKADQSLTRGVNKFIIKKIGFLPLPYKPKIAQTKEESLLTYDFDDKTNINYFWFDNFIYLRQISFLVSLLLLKDPSLSLIDGNILRQIPISIDTNKIKKLLRNYEFIDGGLRKHINTLPSSIEAFGMDLLFSVIDCEALRQRISMLFPPELQNKSTNKRSYSKSQVKLTFFMIKRIQQYFNVNIKN